MKKVLIICLAVILTALAVLWLFQRKKTLTSTNYSDSDSLTHYQKQVFLPTWVLSGLKKFDESGQFEDLMLNYTDRHHPLIATRTAWQILG